MEFGAQGNCTICVFKLIKYYKHSNSFRLTSVTGSPLTNARIISRVLIKDADRPHTTLNLLFMQFGQLLTHDVTQSASITTRMFIYS